MKMEIIDHVANNFIKCIPVETVTIGEDMSDKIEVLIVDDSMMIRTIIEKYLSDFNIEVIGRAANGKEALEIFEDKKPPYVTLDITMPEMDGLSVLKKILEIEPQTRVMIVTALSDKETGLKAIELGAKVIVVKPFSAERLRDSFKRLTKRI